MNIEGGNIWVAGRDLSATVSAQNEVIRDLIKQIEILKARIQELENKL